MSVPFIIFFPAVASWVEPVPPAPVPHPVSSTYLSLPTAAPTVFPRPRELSHGPTVFPAEVPTVLVSRVWSLRRFPRFLRRKTPAFSTVPSLGKTCPRVQNLPAPLTSDPRVFPSPRSSYSCFCV